jgi:hypothetical protein
LKRLLLQKKQKEQKVPHLLSREVLSVLSDREERKFACSAQTE